MKNLKDYILHLDNWIPKKLINTSIKKIDINPNWSRHSWTNAQSYNSKSLFGEKELDVLHQDELNPNESKLIQELQKCVWKAVEKYILIDKLGGNLFTGWKGFSPIRFNKYGKGQSMAKHYDHIHSLFDGQVRGIPILSIVAVLNDDYEGGEFIMFDDYEIKFKSGDLIIFPSVFLYPHLVKPVKKGIRYSFVSWVY